MRKRGGFTLIEIMGVMVLLALFGAWAYRNYGPTQKNAQTRVIAQQADQAQNALNAWVARQRSLAAAASRFSPGPNGALVVPPAQLPALLSEINEILSDSTDALRVEDGHVVTEAMKSRDAYMEITWPTPYRQNYPKFNLTLPD